MKLLQNSFAIRLLKAKLNYSSNRCHGGPWLVFEYSRSQLYSQEIGISHPSSSSRLLRWRILRNHGPFTIFRSIWNAKKRFSLLRNSFFASFPFRFSLFPYFDIFKKFGCGEKMAWKMKIPFLMSQKKLILSFLHIAGFFIFSLEWLSTYNSDSLWVHAWHIYGTIQVRGLFNKDWDLR